MTHEQLLRNAAQKRRDIVTRIQATSARMLATVECFETDAAGLENKADVLAAAREGEEVSRD